MTVNIVFVTKIFSWILTSLRCDTMSEVVTGVLKFTFGLISKKCRSYGAEKLQDGGLTDQKFRGWIVRDLDDIKFQLEAISKNDLYTSVSSLNHGIKRLEKAFEESSKSGNPSELAKDEKESKDSTNAGSSLGQTKPVQQLASVEDAVALASAIRKLKLVSKDRYESAKVCFIQAGNEAKRAFHNAGLSTSEKVLATEVRIASGILENIDDLEFAATDCLHYLQELHDLTAIREIFSVYLQGGMKSFFRADSRYEIVETVTMINLDLADFISKFTNQRVTVSNWIAIKCDKRLVYPFHFRKVCRPRKE